MQHRHLSAPRKRLFLVIVLTLLIGGLVVSGLWMTNAFGWRGFRLTDVQAFIGATLPQEALNPQFVTEDETARIVWVRFSIPANMGLTGLLDDMIPGAMLRESFTPFPNPNYKETDIDWWKPGAAQTFSGLHVIHNNRVYELLVDMTDPNLSVVYLRVYEL